MGAPAGSILQPSAPPPVVPTVPLPFEPVLRAVGQAAAALGVEAFAVGGAVRDALLGRATTDLDVVAVGSGVALARAAAEALGVRPPKVYEAFGTAAGTIPADRLAAITGEAQGERLQVEFVGARKESYRRDSRKPIVEDGTLADDLARRDFTVNALYYTVRNFEVLDYVDGLAEDRKSVV